MLLDQKFRMYNKHTIYSYVCTPSIREAIEGYVEVNAELMSRLRRIDRIVRLVLRHVFFIFFMSISHFIKS